MICNILSTNMEKSILDELAKTGGIVDLVVVTLLRINSILTKEFLAKALFNLMTRVDFRVQMVVQLDVLAAMIELAKIDSLELLELCVRSIYNVSCETLVFCEKMKALRVPSWLVTRSCSSTHISVNFFSLDSIVIFF